MMAEKGYKVLARSRSLNESPWLGLVMSRQKLEKQPEHARKMLRAMRDLVTTIRREKSRIVSYIEKNFKVSTVNAVESYEEISGVIVDGMSMPEAQIQQYLDGAYARGETARPLAASEMFDFRW
jgi:hypothetical protein